MSQWDFSNKWLCLENIIVTKQLGVIAKEPIIVSSVGNQLKSNYGIIFTQLPELPTSMISTFAYSP